MIVEKFTDVDQLAHFVEMVLGVKCNVLTVSPSAGRMTFVLYEAFTFSATIDETTHVFGMALQLPGNASLTTLLGQTLSVNNDPGSIEKALALADQYCRLRLSKNYLAAFDRTHGM